MNDDINEFKTELIVMLRYIIEHFEGSDNLFKDMVDLIICTDDIDELAEFEFNLIGDDNVIENILKKHKIDRKKVIPDATYKRLAHKN